MTLYKLGNLREGGGSVLVCITTPYRWVEWTLVGNGVLTPVNQYTDINGVACATWDATGASEDDIVTITAEVKNA